MKASDIKPGTAYLASPVGTGRYSYKGKAVVIGPGEASNRPGGVRSHRSGHIFWEVEWVKDWDGRGSVPIGERSTIPSAWFDREWGLDDEELGGVIEAQERAADALTKRFVEAFALEEAGMFSDDSRPMVSVKGQKTPAPSYTLTHTAVLQILSYVEGAKP